MKKVILNFAKGGNYPAGQARLIQTLLTYGWDLTGGEIKTWNDESELGAPLHQDDPYGFKVAAWEWALKEGYDLGLWVDASVFASAAVDPVFDHIRAHGYVMEEAGHFAGSWCNQHALDYFGITREKASQIMMYGNAGFLGLDLRETLSHQFIQNWRAALDAGAFRGSWQDHRHDMTCGSIIAHRLGMKPIQPKYLAYVGEPFGTPPETAVFHAQGM